MCGMTNTTGSGEGTMDMTVGRINQLTGQTSQSTMASGYPKIPTCSTGYCTCITKDAEIKRLTDEVALLKRTDRESRDEWLKSWGFGLFAVLKHGPIGEVLALLQDGWISRGKAAEAMAEIMLGNTPNLPERKSSAFDDLDIPCDVVNELRRCAFELSNDKDMALGKLDQALNQINQLKLNAAEKDATIIRLSKENEDGRNRLLSGQFSHCCGLSGFGIGRDGMSDVCPMCRVASLESENKSLLSKVARLNQPVPEVGGHIRDARTKLSAALRREEVLREALKEIMALETYLSGDFGLGVDQGYEAARSIATDALSACDEGRK